MSATEVNELQLTNRAYMNYPTQTIGSCNVKISAGKLSENFIILVLIYIPSHHIGSEIKLDL